MSLAFVAVGHAAAAVSFSGTIVMLGGGSLLHQHGAAALRTRGRGQRLDGAVAWRAKPLLRLSRSASAWRCVAWVDSSATSPAASGSTTSQVSRGRSTTLMLHLLSDSCVCFLKRLS